MRLGLGLLGRAWPCDVLPLSSGEAVVVNQGCTRDEQVDYEADRDRVVERKMTQRRSSTEAALTTWLLVVLLSRGRVVSSLLAVLTLRWRTVLLLLGVSSLLGVAALLHPALLAVLRGSGVSGVARLGG